MRKTKPLLAKIVAVCLVFALIFSTQSAVASASAWNNSFVTNNTQIETGIDLENHFVLRFKCFFREILNNLFDSFGFVSNIMVTGVNIEEREIAINMGDSYALVAKIAPAKAKNRNVIWRTGDSDIITIDANGVVTGLQTGSATVYAVAKDGGFYDKCKITIINKARPCTAINVASADLNLAMASTSSIPVILSPLDTTDVLNVKTSDASVVTAKVVKNTLVVTANGEGSAVITLSCGSITKNIATTVTKPAPQTFTVTYIGGTTEGSVPVDTNQYLSGDKVVVPNINTISKDGYVCTGWNTEADYSGIHYNPDDTFIITGDTVLYAVWFQRPQMISNAHSIKHGDKVTYTITAVVPESSDNFTIIAPIPSGTNYVNDFTAGNAVYLGENLIWKFTNVECGDKISVNFTVIVSNNLTPGAAFKSNATVSYARGSVSSDDVVCVVAAIEGDETYCYFDESTKTLTVYGEGVVNYGDFKNTPWYDFSSEIDHIVISEGITAVSGYPFYGIRCSTITLPSTMCEIDMYKWFYNNGEIKDKIIVSEYNEYFCSDMYTLYSKDLTKAYYTVKSAFATSEYHYAAELTEFADCFDCLMCGNYECDIATLYTNEFSVPLNVCKVYLPSLDIVNIPSEFMTCCAFELHIEGDNVKHEYIYNNVPASLAELDAQYVASDYSGCLRLKIVDSHAKTSSDALRQTIFAEAQSLYYAFVPGVEIDKTKINNIIISDTGAKISDFYNVLDFDPFTVETDKYYEVVMLPKEMDASFYSFTVNVINSDGSVETKTFDMINDGLTHEDDVLETAWILLRNMEPFKYMVRSANPNPVEAVREDSINFLIVATSICEYVVDKDNDGDITKITFTIDTRLIKSEVYSITVRGCAENNDFCIEENIVPLFATEDYVANLLKNKYGITIHENSFSKIDNHITVYANC